MTAASWSGTALRAARKRTGKKQEEIADAVGISRTYYNKLETGNRKLTERNARLLAPHLGVEPSELLEPDASEPALAGPLDRLAELEAKVARLEERQETQAAGWAAFLQRVEDLETAVAAIAAAVKSDPAAPQKHRRGR